MPRASKPTELRIRTYQVGFGDCFLLTFAYPEEKKHILIDFGTTGVPDGSDKAVLTKVAEQIKKDAKELTAVIATHRHRDHIRGFSTEKRDGTPGTVIASLKPKLVMQPWTEDPELPTDATQAAATPAARKNISSDVHYLSVLDSMNRLSASLADLPMHLSMTAAGGELRFLGQTNLKNLSAVKNLQTIGKKADEGSEYLCYGSATKLEKLLPGVKVHVLGPPTIKQHAEVEKMASRAPEFWMLQSRFWLDKAQVPAIMTGTAERWKGAKVRKPASTPLWARWFVQKTSQVHASELLALVRILDDVMNNTSLILLFQIGDKAFLFPGDAQIENWEYALKYAPGHEAVDEMLKKVTLYKVGHHGSRNATPKTLYELMAEKRAVTGELRSVVSTMANKHGKKESNTEVPRRTLMTALRKAGPLFSTEKLRGDAQWHDEVFAL